MPERDTIVSRLIQEADEARLREDEDQQSQGNRRLNQTLAAWGLPWTTTDDEFCVPGTEVVLTAVEESTGLRVAFSCPVCKEPITRIIHSAFQLGTSLAIAEGIIPWPKTTHRCYEVAKREAYAALIDPRKAASIVKYCEDIRDEADRQAEKTTNNERAQYLLGLKLRTVEIEATIRAGFARGGDHKIDY